MASAGGTILEVTWPITRKMPSLAQKRWIISVLHIGSNKTWNCRETSLNNINISKINITWSYQWNMKILNLAHFISLRNLQEDYYFRLWNCLSTFKMQNVNGKVFSEHVYSAAESFWSTRKFLVYSHSTKQKINYFKGNEKKVFFKPWIDVKM